MIAAREHVISKQADLQQFLDAHPLHHLYGGEHAFLLDRYVGALTRAGFCPLEILSPLKSPINLFPYTIDSLRDAVIDKVSRKLSAKWAWQMVFASDQVFLLLLAVAGNFDNRPGRLYSFVGHKGQP